MARALRGLLEPTDFVIPGLLGGLALATPTGGQRQAAFQQKANTMRIRQRVDGTAGTTTLHFYKRTAPGARVSLGTVSLAFGGGANATATATIGATIADRQFAPGDCAEVEVDAIQVGIAAADITGTLEWG